MNRGICCAAACCISAEDAKLPEGRYFIVDLLGLSVVDADTGQQYGELTQVYQTGANDVYEITAPTGKKYLIPVIDSVGAGYGSRQRDTDHPADPGHL